MNAETLRELQDRGRFFYQNFPGAAAADEWRRQRDRLDEKKTNTAESGGEAGDEEAPFPSTTSPIARARLAPTTPPARTLIGRTIKRDHHGSHANKHA
jgi:hypothetical protein